MNNAVEQARKMLESDLADNPYILLDGPLGHAVSYRKIQNYLFVCVTNNVSKADCVNWLYNLYIEQNEKQFRFMIDASANMLYDFYDYLNK